jgi:hypothetical protein
MADLMRINQSGACGDVRRLEGQRFKLTLIMDSTWSISRPRRKSVTTYVPITAQMHPVTDCVSVQTALANLRAFTAPPTNYYRCPLKRRAAVLILLFADRRGDLRVVLTIRSAGLKNCRHRLPASELTMRGLRC